MEEPSVDTEEPRDLSRLNYLNNLIAFRNYFKLGHLQAWFLVSDRGWFISYRFSYLLSDEVLRAGVPAALTALFEANRAIAGLGEGTYTAAAAGTLKYE